MSHEHPPRFKNRREWVYNFLQEINLRIIFTLRKKPKIDFVVQLQEIESRNPILRFDEDGYHGDKYGYNLHIFSSKEPVIYGKNIKLEQKIEICFEELKNLRKLLEKYRYKNIANKLPADENLKKILLDYKNKIISEKNNKIKFELRESAKTCNMDLILIYESTRQLIKTLNIKTEEAIQLDNLIRKSIKNKDLETIDKIISKWEKKGYILDDLIKKIYIKNNLKS